MTPFSAGRKHTIYAYLTEERKKALIELIYGDHLPLFALFLKGLSIHDKRTHFTLWCVWLSSQKLEGEVFSNYSATLPLSKNNKQKNVIVGEVVKSALLRLAQDHAHTINVNVLLSAIADGKIKVLKTGEQT